MSTAISLGTQFNRRRLLQAGYLAGVGLSLGDYLRLAEASEKSARAKNEKPRGTADSVILLENRGRTTSASIEAVARIMNEKRLDEAILVSDPFHMLRLQILAKQHGVPSVTSPTRTSPISANRLEAAGYILSESVKVPATLVLGLLGR